MKSKLSAATGTGFRILHVRPYGNPFILLLCLQFLISFSAFAQPPVPSGDCMSNTLYFNSSTNISPTINALSSTTQGSGTWEAWVKKANWAAYNSDEKLFMNDYDYPLENCFYLSLHSAVGFHFRTGYTDGVYVSSVATKSFAADTWHHLAATWSESEGTVTITIYIDGVYVDHDTSTSTFDLGTSFHIGGKDGSYKLQGGQMADVRVWNVARTQTEISNNRHTPLDGDETGLVAYWPLNEEVGSTTAAELVSGGLNTVNYINADTDWIPSPITFKTDEIIQVDGTYDFGKLQIGDTPVPVVFTLTNNTNSALELSDYPFDPLTGTNADQFDMDISSLPAWINSNESTTFTITFSPTTDGVKTALFSYAENGSSCPDPYTINLTGIGSTLEASVSVDSNVLIYGQSTGSLTANPTGGVLPYSYLWSNGATDATATGLAAGDYSVVVTDDIGVSLEVEATISQPSALVASISVDANNTIAGGSDGELTASATGGVAPYSYLWSNGATTATIIDLPAGDYEVTVTDDSGATDSETATITQPDPVIGFSAAGFTEQEANDGSVSGSITFTLSGDTFQDEDGDNVMDAGTEVIIGNVPVGLTPVLTLNSSTEVVLTLTGNAFDHQNANDVADITFEFTDDAFWNLDASDFTGATGSAGVGIDFNDTPVITYSGVGFTESVANDGTMTGHIAANLTGGYFANKSELVNDTDYSIDLPENLVPTVSVTRTQFGESWVLGSGSTDQNWQELTYGAGKFVAVANGTDEVMVSEDGINWITTTAPSSENWNDVAYGAGKFVAVASTGTNRIMTSPDGINWTANSYAGTGALRSIVYANGLFVVVGPTNVVTSPDGETWTQLSNIPAGGWWGVTHGNGLYVAVAYYGSNYVMTSPDGATWTARTAAEENVWRDITYGNGLFAAVASSGVNMVMTSSDGITWTSRHAPYVMESVTYGNGLYVATTTGSQLVISTDGTTWTSKAVSSGNWNGITFGNGMIVSVAATGSSSSLYSETKVQAVLTLSGAATAHDNSADLENIHMTFNDSAFDGIPASSVTNAVNGNTGSRMNFFDAAPSIAYSGTGFSESAANVGQVEGSIIITLTEDTFQDTDADNLVDVGSEVLVYNIPTGFTPLITITSANTAEITLSGSAESHQSGDNVSDITFEFDDTAFSEVEASVVSNATGPASSALGISFLDNPSFSLSGDGFTETVANDGSVSGSLIIDLSGDTFSGSIDIGNGVMIDNVPVGLTATLTSNSSTQIELTLSGNATDHEAEHDLAELTFSFSDIAFSNSDVSMVLNATGTIGSGVGISFMDSPVLSYTGIGFTEGQSNNGSLEGYISITLEGHTFSDTDENQLLDYGTQYTITNLPSGLIPQLTVNTTTASLSLSEGFADVHQPSDNISDLVINFNDAAFTSVKAENIVNATNVSTGLGISYNYARGSLSFSGGFTEPSSNDGSLVGSAIVTLTGDTFTDPDMDGFLSLGSQVYVSAPYQMTPVLVLNSPTELEVFLEGNAYEHQDQNDRSYLQIDFYDQAFTNSNSAEISNSSFYHNEISIDFNENAGLTYTGDGFTETEDNRGAVSGSIILDLVNDTFADPDEDGYLTIPGQLTLQNLPAGLTPVASLTSNSQLVLTLTGSAFNHENADDLSSVNFQFTDDAFTITPAQYVENAIDPNSGSGFYRSERGIDFESRQAGISFDGTGFTETEANDGSVEGDIKVFLRGDTFEDDGDGLLDVSTQVTLANIPSGLTPTVTITSNNSAGYDWNSTFNSGDGRYVTVTYGDGLFVALANHNTNRLATSPDGINWTKSTSLDTEEWAAVTYGNGTFVAVCYSGSYYSYTSTDGVNWTAGAAMGEIGWQEVVYGNGLFVATKRSGTNKVMTSTDGANWTEYAGDSNIDNYLAYGNGTYVSCGYNNGENAAVSTDGINWTAYPLSASESYYFGVNEIAYGNGKFVMVCDYVEDDGVQNNNVVLTSSDGITWSIHEVQGTELSGVVYGDGIFVANGEINGGSDDAILVSEDGETWEVLPDVPGFGWNEAIYANGGFVTVNQGWSNEGWGSYQIMTSFPGAEAVLTLTGNADDHQPADDVADITFGFTDAAFTSSLAADVPGATGPVSTDLGIVFEDNTPANDDCANPEAVMVYAHGEGTPSIGSTEFSVPNPGSSLCSAESNIRDVWYSFNTGDATQIIFNIETETATAVSAAIYTSCGELFQIHLQDLGSYPACVPNITQPLILSMPSNTDFLIQIWTLDGEEGSFTGFLEKNTPPEIDLITDKTVNEETELTFTVSATDDYIPGGQINYILGEQSLDLGMTIDELSGEFSWTPGENQDGSYTVDIYAADYINPDRYTVSYSQATFNITVNEVNKAPQLGTLVAQNVAPESSVYYEVTATDVDLPAQTLHFSIDQSSIDKGMYIDESDYLRWTPQPEHYGTTNNVDVTVSDGTLSETATLVITVGKADQEISFDSPGDYTFGETSGISFNAYGGDSGNPVVFTSSDENVATISGSDANIVGAGEVTFYANQAGNTGYNAAPEVSHTITIYKADQYLSFDTPGSFTYGETSSFELSAYSGDSGIPIVFTSSDETVITISESTATVVGAGDVTIYANQAGNGNYNPAEQQSGSLTIYKADQELYFDSFDYKTFGDEPFELSTTGGDSGNPIVFTSSNESVATISGNTVTIEGAGDATIYANQAGNNNYNPAYEQSQSLYVQKAYQEISFSSIENKTFGDPSFELMATGGASGNPIIFTTSDTDVIDISGNTVTIVGAGYAYINATQAGDDNFEEAYSDSQSFEVYQADQEIIFEGIEDKSYSDEPFELVATGGDSGNPVIFTTYDDDVISISGNTVTIVGIGYATIYATQTGNTNYYEADEISQSFEVTGPSTNTWTGSYWTEGYAPSEYDDAIIDGDYVFSEQGSFSAGSLAVNAEATLTVDSQSSLVVNDNFTNEGNVIIASGSSLLSFGSVSGAGFQIDRGTTFDQNTGRYSIVGSPVQNAGFDALGQSALIYAYDESAPYNPSGNQGLDKFSTPAQLEMLGMQPAEGYFSAFTGDETGLISFTGTPNHGSIQVALSYTDQGSTEEEPYEGFNLVSNPYPAAISFSSLIDGNNNPDMDESIYLWDDYGSDTERGTNADYLIVNPSLGSTNSRADGEEKWDGYIRSGQGFFVKANAATTLQFSDDMKVPGNNSDDGFFRKASIKRYKLAISDAENRKATIVGFVSDATLGKDKAYDALTFGGTGLQLYSLQVEGDNRLGIQGLPDDFQGEVKLGYSSAVATDHTISLMNLDEVGESVVLYDSYTGITTDLKAQAYTFATASGKFEDRFVLRTARPLATISSRPLIYAFGKTLHIEHQAAQPSEYRLFNLAGVTVFKAIVGGTININLDHLSNGVYLVSDGIETKKIILK